MYARFNQGERNRRNRRLSLSRSHFFLRARVVSYELYQSLSIYISCRQSSVDKGYIIIFYSFVYIRGRHERALHAWQHVCGVASALYALVVCGKEKMSTGWLFGQCFWLECCEWSWVVGKIVMSLFCAHNAASTRSNTIKKEEENTLLLLCCTIKIHLLRGHIYLYTTGSTFASLSAGYNRKDLFGFMDVLVLSSLYFRSATEKKFSCT